MDDGKIIDFTAKREEREESKREVLPKGWPTAKLDASFRSFQGCQHKYVVVSDVHESERVVECRHCEAKLDAFTVLWQFAIQERQFESKREAAKRELDDILKRIDLARRELARVQGKVRRARSNRT